MEIINVNEQTVASSQNVLFTNTVTCGNACINHRTGSGLVILRGNTCQSRARYKVSFGANVAVPADGTAGAIQLALAIEGEGLASSTMIATPAAVSEYHNVFGAMFIDVPKGTSLTVSVKNTSAVDVLVQNANLIVERVA